jgi:hypothetical protein
LCAIGNISLQRACYTILPGIDILIQLEAADQIYNRYDRHAMSEGAGDQFGIIPIFRIEFVG